MSEARKPWLFGPAPDLLWGSGLAYLAVFLLLLFAGSEVRVLAPGWVMALLVVLVSMPHYGATLVRVYESRSRYRAIALLSTLLLALLFVWGLSNVTVGSLLFTLYLTWSPWHYTGQNYGITLMFLGRQGLRLEAEKKRRLHLSFVLSFVIMLFFIHGPSTTSVSISPEIRFLSLGVPALTADLMIFCLSIAYVLVTARVTYDLWRVGGRRSVTALLLMLTQAVWFVLPAWISNWIPYSDSLPLSRQFVQYSYAWVALGHAAQYLWVTYFFARRSGPTTRLSSFYARALLVGCAVWTVPALLFAPGVLGSLPYNAGLAGLVAAVVNLHHFVLDGAIWKLRDGHIAAVLLKVRRTSESESSSEVPMPSRLPRLVGAVGLLSLFVHLAGGFEEEFGLRRALSRQDLDRAEVALGRLAWLGRESDLNREAVGVRARRLGELERSERQLRIALSLRPTARRFIELGDVLKAQGKLSAAAEAYERASELDPQNKDALLLLALTQVELGAYREARRIILKPELDELRGTARSDRLHRRLTSLLNQGAPAPQSDPSGSE